MENPVLTSDRPRCSARGGTRFLPGMAVVCLCLFQSGCVSAKRATTALPPVIGEQLRARLGSVAIVPGWPATNFTLPRSVGRGAAASKGLAGGVAQGAAMGLGEGRGNPLALVITVPVGLTLGAVIGTVTGFARGLSKREMKAAEEQLQAAHATLLELNLQETLLRDFRHVAEAQVPRQQLAWPEPCPPQHNRQQFAQELARNGTQCLLEITFRNAGFYGVPGKTRPLTVFLATEVRLFSVPEAGDLYTHTWTLRGASRPLAEWTRNDCGLLRQEIARLSTCLAETVVDELFLGYEPQSPKNKQAKKGV